jgi:lysophospholipase L1-like esterase
MRCVVALLLLAATACSAEGPTVPAPNPYHPERVKQLAEAATDARGDVLFLGDSLIEHWTGTGRASWDRHFAPLGAVNMGLGWARTQNLLWRLRQGHLDPIGPRVVVLLIGTNNTEHGKDDPRSVADGIAEILSEIGSRMPEVRVLLVGIVPRGRDASDPHRQNNEAVNRLLARMGSDRVRYVDAGAALVAEDGTVIAEHMQGDLLHVSAEGYEALAQILAPPIRELLGER